MSAENGNSLRVRFLERWRAHLSPPLAFIAGGILVAVAAWV